MKPRVGSTLFSTSDDTTVVVVRWTAGDLELTCGGTLMVDKPPAAEARQVGDPAQQEGTQLGKRYTADEAGVELLCTKAGKGGLALGGTPLTLKSAKPLPASD